MRDRLRSAATRVWDWAGASGEYWLVRFLFLRVLGLVYLAAFLSLAFQVEPLLGSQGLTPVADVVARTGLSPIEGFLQAPSILWFAHADWVLTGLAWAGVVVSALVLIGLANIPMLIFNWFVYLSFVNLGQIWYGYGWETQLVETGFLAILLVPLLDPRPFRAAPPRPVIWLLRWLAVRVHLGAGLIKIRGDACWRELTCLHTHFETQPIPNPLSPYFHALPDPLLKLGVLYNHIAELLAPITVIAEPLTRAVNRLAARFDLQRADMDRAASIRNLGGVTMLLLQAVLILSGNLSFLNWLTIAAIIAFFDDEFLSRFLPDRLVRYAEDAKQEATSVPSWRRIASLLLVVLVAVLSIPVVVNLISPNQAMNTSFNNWRLVNTYGAFGSVTEQRHELIIQGTHAADPSPGDWKTYDVPAKPDFPGDPLPVVAPYQPRLSWQLWFAAMQTPGRNPWLLHLVWKLLDDNPSAEQLLADNPFPDRPPRAIRIVRYRYTFAPPHASQPWNVQPADLYLPPVTRNTTQLERYVQRRWGTQ